MAAAEPEAALIGRGACQQAQNDFSAAVTQYLGGAPEPSPKKETQKKEIPPSLALQLLFQNLADIHGDIRIKPCYLNGKINHSEAHMNMQNQKPPEMTGNESSAVGLSQMILGIGVIVTSSVAAWLTTLILGIILIARGGLDLYHGFRRTGDPPHRSASMQALGAISLALGVLLLVWPEIGAAVFALALAALFAIGGFQKLITPWTQKRPADSVTVMSGAVSILLAALLIALWPVESFGVLGAFAGIEIMLNGMTITYVRRVADSASERFAGR